MRPPAPATRVLLVALCAMLFGLGQFHRASGGVLSPLLAEVFSLTGSQLGLTISLMFFGVVLMQLPIGAALDRFGVTLVLPLSLCVMAGATLLFAAAATTPMLMASRLLLGAGAAALTASTHIIVSRLVANARFGLANGLVVSFGGVGGVVGAFPLAAAVTTYGWRPVFVMIAIGTVGLALAIFAVLASTRRFGPPPRPAATTEPADAPSFLQLLSRADFLRILAMASVAFAPITAITGLWGGPFYKEVHGLDTTTIGAVLSAMYAAIILAAFTFGGLDAWIRSRRRLVLCGAATSSTLILLAALVPYESIWPVTVCLVVMIFSQQFYIPLAAHMQKIMPAASLGRASALFSIVGMFGISATQIGFGIVIDLAHDAGFATPEAYRLAFGMMAAAIALMAMVYATGRDASK